MIFFRPIFLASFLAFLAAYCAGGVAYGQSAQDSQALANIPLSGYLSADQQGQIAIEFLLTPPMGLAAQDDWDSSLAMVRNRPSNIADIIAQEAYPDIFTIFSPVLGPDFTANQYPQLAQLAARIMVDGGAISGAVKRRYQRLRPYQLAGFGAAGLLVCTQMPENPGASFPSGHAVMAEIYGAMLADLMPARRAEILARAAHFADPRVACGIHYISDIAAGRALGQNIYAALESNIDFRQSIASVRESIETPR